MIYQYLFVYGDNNSIQSLHSKELLSETSDNLIMDTGFSLCKIRNDLNLEEQSECFYYYATKLGEVKMGIVGNITLKSAIAKTNHNYLFDGKDYIELLQRPEQIVMVDKFCKAPEDYKDESLTFHQITNTITYHKKYEPAELFLTLDFDENDALSLIYSVLHACFKESCKVYFLLSENKTDILNLAKNLVQAILKIIPKPLTSRLGFATYSAAIQEIDLNQFPTEINFIVAAGDVANIENDVKQDELLYVFGDNKAVRNPPVLSECTRDFLRVLYKNIIAGQDYLECTKLLESILALIHYEKVTCIEIPAAIYEFYMLMKSVEKKGPGIDEDKVFFTFYWLYQTPGLLGDKLQKDINRFVTNYLISLTCITKEQIEIVMILFQQVKSKRDEILNHMSNVLMKDICTNKGKVYRILLSSNSRSELMAHFYKRLDYHMVLKGLVTIKELCELDKRLYDSIVNWDLETYDKMYELCTLDQKPFIEELKEIRLDTYMSKGTIKDKNELLKKRPIQEEIRYLKANQNIIKSLLKEYKESTKDNEDYISFFATALTAYKDKDEIIDCINKKDGMPGIALLWKEITKEYQEESILWELKSWMRPIIKYIMKLDYDAEILTSYEESKQELISSMLAGLDLTDLLYPEKTYAAALEMNMKMLKGLELNWRNEQDRFEKLRIAKTSNQEKKSKKPGMEKLKHILTKGHDLSRDQIAQTLETLSDMEDTYGMLLTRLNYLSHTENIKVVALTSVTENEEKMIHICNLARTHAKEGKKVLIIDCNKNTNALHYLGVEFKEMARVQKMHNSSGYPILKVPETNRLNIVPAGLLLTDENGNLNVNKIKDMLEKIRERYHLILMDGLASGTMNEGVKVTQMADGTILIVKSGQTPKDLAIQLKDMFNSLRVNVLGVILEK